MIELLILISGIVALWKFHSTINASTVAAKAHTEVWAEDVIANAQIRRSEQVEKFKASLTNEDGSKRQLYSHDEVMQLLKS